MYGLKALILILLAVMHNINPSIPSPVPWVCCNELHWLGEIKSLLNVWFQEFCFSCTISVKEEREKPPHFKINVKVIKTLLL